MTYNEQQKQALSQKVADKYGVSPINAAGLWLHEDWHGTMELCVKHGVNAEIKTFKDSGYMHTLAKAVIPSGRWFVIDVKDHNNDPSEAERIARLLALGEL